MESRADNPLSGFPEYLKNLLVDIQTSGDFADVTLVCDDQQQIRAHRNILSACSPVFKNILRISASNPHSVVYLRGIQHEEMLSILQFVYLGQVTFSEDRVEQFLSVAKDLEIKELNNKMEQDQSFSPKSEIILQNDQEGGHDVEENTFRVNSEDTVQNTEMFTLEYDISQNQKLITKDEVHKKDVLQDQKVEEHFFNIKKNNEDLDQQNLEMSSSQNKPQPSTGVGRGRGKKNVYDPNAPWILNLIANFKEQVIDPLSYRTRTAVKLNERIEDRKIKKHVRLEIVRRLAELIFENSGTSGMAVIQKLLIKLGHVYPAMFYEDKDTDHMTGHGLGGKHGNRELGKQMLTRLRAMKDQYLKMNYSTKSPQKLHLF